MPWAKDDLISKSPIEGGIEITPEQYKGALAGVMEGKKVAVRSGEFRLLSAEKRTVYSIENGSEYTIAENDDTPEGYTDDEKPSAWHIWSQQDGEWVEDADLKRAATVPVSITPRQMLLGLMSYKLITEEEALGAAKTGAVPASVQVIFDNLPTSAEKVAAEITWAKMSIVERGHELVGALAVANDMSEEDVDAFFIACSKL